MNFSDIALNQLLTEFPELGPYIMSFKEMNDELPEDQGVSAGVVLVNLAGHIFYVPVVAKGDQIFPFDSLYNAETQAFSPLTRTLIKDLLSSGQNTLGDMTRIPAEVNRNPSIYEMVTPPRTGKYVYAGTSRFTEFLAATPGHMKKAFEEGIFKRASLVKRLHEIYGMDSITEALKYEYPSVSEGTVKQEAPGSDEIRNLLSKGYHFGEGQVATRLAIATENFDDTKFFNAGNTDTDYEADFVMKVGGDCKRGYVANSRTTGAVFIFEDGSYAVPHKGVKNPVIKGNLIKEKDKMLALTALAENMPPKPIRTVNMGEKFVVMNPMDSTVFGPFEATKVTLTNLGVEISGCTLGARESVEIKAYHGFTGAPVVVKKAHGNVAFFNSTDVVLTLGGDIRSELENDPVLAKHVSQARLTSGMFDPQSRLVFNSGSYALDRKILGRAQDAVKVLVIEKGLSPDLAETLMKTASEIGEVTFAMSKQAADTIGFVPGTVDGPAGSKIESRAKNPLAVPFNPEETLPSEGLDNMAAAAQVGDQEVLEATIISQMLQNPDLHGLVSEYMPDLEHAQDRLGRILLTLRVKVTELTNGGSADEVFSLISQVRNVYKMLGDSLLRLKQLTTSMVAQEA